MKQPHDEGESSVADPVANDTGAARQRLLELRRLKREAESRIERRSPDATLPLSSAQQGLWFLDQVGGQSSGYHISRAIGLTGVLDVAALQRSLHALVERHEVLRTGFERHDGGAIQVVHPVERVAAELLLIPTPVAGTNAAERRVALDKTVSALINAPFDLTRAPLIRTHLLRLTSDDHVLVLVVHHIVSDGWSMGVLARELELLYAAGGDPSGLPALPFQFADYAQWQQQQLASGALKSQLGYWTEKLKGLEPLELPTDRPRSAQPSQRAGLFRFEVDAGQLGQLKALALREEATLFMILLSAFKVLLMRHSGQQDMALGVPLAGRNRLELQALIGYFVNTLVMRTDLGDNPRFSELLSRVRHTALDAFANQDLPFDRIVAELSPTRDLSRNPLYQVAFVLQNTPEGEFSLDGLEVRRIDLPKSTSIFDLMLSITESDGVLCGSLEYATDLFDASTVARFAGHFQALLAGIAADPSQRIGSLPMLSHAERQQLLRDWNRTAMDWPQQECTHHLFEAQAKRSPDSVAVVFGAQELRYAELDAKANRLANQLRSRGLGRGALVGLCLERGIAMLVAQLAILKSGAAYVPLDPAYPAERLHYMAQDAQLALLISESSLTQALQWPSDRQLLLDRAGSTIALQSPLPPDANPALDARPEDPAYVIYTSGSTGEPKGVMVAHRGVVSFLASMARAPGLGANDRVLAVTTLSFDIAVLELLLPLSVGATIVLASREQALDGRALRGLLESNSVNLMQATPSTWRMLIESGWRVSAPFRALIGGEGLPVDLARQLLDRGAELWNMYGPTETTVWSTCWKVEDPERGISIGRPISNTHVYILDARMQLCPQGAAGEICIGGPGVAIGYLGRVDLTAERFVDDPFTPGAKLYRTGDRGRWRSDGTLEHLGRLDFQVKVRGYRIELGEIESNLATHPSVQRSVVITREDKPGDVCIVAYVVCGAQPPAPGALRSHLREKLPDYMLPQFFVSINAIPLLPNGKIDRGALPAPGQGESPRHAAAATPHSEAEKAIAAIWQRLLDIEHVSVTDNFFELGGHSMLAMRAVEEIERQLGTRLMVRSLVHESLAALATTVESAARQPLEKPAKPSGWRARVASLIGR